MSTSLRNSRCVFFPSCERPSFIPIHKITDRIIFLCNVAERRPTDSGFLGSDNSAQLICPLLLHLSVLLWFTSSHIWNLHDFFKRDVSAIFMFWFYSWFFLQEMNSYFLYGSIGVYVKGQGHSMTCMCRNRRRWRHSSQPIRSLGARRGWAVSTMPRPLYLPIVRAHM